MEQAERHFQVEHQPGIDLRIYDPAFRHEYSIEAPGHGDEIDAIFYDILLSPAGMRSLGVNQLSKSPVEETYEGSTDFKRWQHVAGVYHLVRHYARQAGCSNEEIVQYALIACIPDLGHGVKSHVTDMLKEGVGGNEDFHEQRAGQVIDLGGIQQILSQHKVRSPFNSDGQILINVPEWVDCPSPGLCADRLHYINAEASLLFPNNEAVKEVLKLENLIIKDGKFVFKSRDQATVWAKAANLCSSEHWNDPTNRLTEMLSLEAIKRTISRRYLENVDSFDNGYIGAAEDYTFLIDQDFDQALEREALSPRPDIFMNAAYSLIQSIAHRERQRFAKHKKPAYEQYIADSDAREYPNALVNPHRAAFGIPPAQVEILRSNDLFDVTEGDAVLQLADERPVGILKRLKIRQFDPLVMQGASAEPLSSLDSNFRQALAEHGQALNYVGAVALHANPESRDALIEGVSENKDFIARSRSFSSLSPDQIRAIIASSAARAHSFAIENGTWIEQ